MELFHNVPCIIVIYNTSGTIKRECENDWAKGNLQGAVEYFESNYFDEIKDAANLEVGVFREIEFTYNSGKDIINYIARIEKTDNNRVTVIIIDNVYSAAEYNKIHKEKITYATALSLSSEVFFEYCGETDSLTFIYNIEGSYNVCNVKVEKFRENFFENRYIFDLDKEEAYKIFRNPPQESAEYEIRLRVKTCDDFKWHHVHIQNVNVGRLYYGTILNIDKRKKEEYELKKKALYDPLSKVYNRAAAIEIIDGLLLGYGQENRYSLFVIDIDNFKMINDKFGHLYGDAVISMTGKIIKNIVGKDNVVGRFGGDEFFVFTKTYDRSQLNKILENIRVSMMNLRLDKSAEHDISCSIGVTIGNGNVSFEELFKQADSALYDAKKLGKNKAVFFSGEYNDEQVLKRVRIETKDKDESNEEIDITATALEIAAKSSTPDMAVINVMQHIGYTMNFDLLEIFKYDTNENTVQVEFQWCRCNSRGEYNVYSIQKKFGYYVNSDILRFKKYFNENKIFMLDDEFKEGFSRKFRDVFEYSKDYNVWYSSYNSNEDVFYATIFHSKDKSRVLTDKDKTNMLEATRILSVYMKSLSAATEREKAFQRKADYEEHGLYRIGKFYEESGKITRAAIEKDSRLAVVHFDFENFHRFNSVNGVDEGDRVMNEFAKWLLINTDDIRVSCHLEGTDQFITLFRYNRDIDIRALIEEDMNQFVENLGEYKEFPLYIKAGMCTFESGAKISEAIDYARELKRDLKPHRNICLEAKLEDYM